LDPRAHAECKTNANAEADPNKMVEMPATSLPRESRWRIRRWQSTRSKFHVKPQQLYTPHTSRASELDMMKPSNRGTSNEEFSSTRLIPITADRTYPYTTVGKLFFTIPGQVTMSARHPF